MKLDINEVRDSNIIRIQKNLIMMDFDIEMINKILLYFNIESEDQAIDYLTKNSEGLWQHPFIEKIKDNNMIIEEEENKDKNGLIKGMTSKIKELKNKSISNIVYDSFTNESHISSGDSNDHLSICEICGESESMHLNSNMENNDNNIEDFKHELIIDSNENLESIDNDININNNEININNDNNNEVYTHNNNICQICLDELTNPVEIETCHHRFCQECFIEYLSDLIKNKKIEKIPCPEKNCSVKEIKEEFFSNYLTEEEYFKYRTMRSQLEIMKDPKKMFCPHCDSYASIPNENFILDTNNAQYVKTTMTCMNGHQFCSCGIALHDGDCYKDSNDFQKFLINENVKQCPKCGFYIKKLKGCNHMTCGNLACKFEFCWLCMREAVPGHFQFGKCKGMQFIDTTGCIYKLKLRYPCLYKLYALMQAILAYLIIVLLPSLIFILCFLIIFLEHDTLKFRNTFSKILYLLTGSFILFALNNIGHSIIAFLTLLLLLGCFCRIFICILKIYHQITNMRFPNPV